MCKLAKVNNLRSEALDARLESEALTLHFDALLPLRSVEDTIGVLPPAGFGDFLVKDP